jgi:hypothetical protein
MVRAAVRTKTRVAATRDGHAGSRSPKLICVAGAGPLGRASPSVDRGGTEIGVCRAPENWSDHGRSRSMRRPLPKDQRDH